MKTSALAKEQPAATPPIVPLEGQAPVMPSGIANKSTEATHEQVAAYAASIRAGKPPGKIFPHKMGEMIFTDAQREVIRLARKAHKEACIAAKKDLIKIVSAKNVLTVGHRTNRDGTKGRVGYVKQEAFAGKDGKFDQSKLDKFIAGPLPKAAKA